MTVFKDILGFEERYQISEEAEVYSLPKKWVTNGGGIQHHNGKILKVMTDNTGYNYVNLQKNGVGYRSLLHRLMAITFIPNPSNLPEVNHLDGDKANNKIENLEWITHRNNVIHAHTNGLASTKEAIESTKIKVINTENKEVFNSISDAAKHVSIDRRHLCMMLRGERPNRTNFILLK